VKDVIDVVAVVGTLNIYSSELCPFLLGRIDESELNSCLAYK
jgi:hypothetical protein